MFLLRDTYNHVDDIEFYVGLFAEEKIFGGLHGPSLLLMGVGLTYSTIFISKLLLPSLYKPSTFSQVG